VALDQQETKNPDPLGRHVETMRDNGLVSIFCFGLVSQKFVRFSQMTGHSVFLRDWCAVLTRAKIIKKILPMYSILSTLKVGI
jgi:hypothetical protein